MSANTNFGQSLARSMTIEEMRALHRKALSDAEAKKTELRLVLASRYRELVGSSDEVIKMNERARELHDLMTALPGLMEKLVHQTTLSVKEEQEENEARDDGSSKNPNAGIAEGSSQAVLELRQRLSSLPRKVHRAMDKGDVHGATESIVELFRLISGQTDEYPLATALAASGMLATSSSSPSPSLESMDTLLQAQIRMTFLHVQTLPTKITKMAKQILLHSAGIVYAEKIALSSSRTIAVPDAVDPKFGAETSAAALSALNLLEIRQDSLQRHGQESNTRSFELLDLYFDSKANLLQLLLDQLFATPPSQPQQLTGGANEGESSTKSATGSRSNNAEDILSKIVLILQYDIILHPYQIFVLREFPSRPTTMTSSSAIMKSLPMFPAPIVQAKVSKFLSAHLPLIRTKVKSVLVDIAGTTASALGKIRQSLYDKTDGAECVDHLNSNGVCTWEEAVNCVVDIPSVLSQSGIDIHGSSPVGGSQVGDGSGMDFSLWGVLFSNTFSSLVHSLLTSSFHSVHAKVVSTLRLSLANAPAASSILPHEAHRNTLHIASALDAALLKVSADAHELLVHAEERVESERRLRQSLYVQTCEIMGRLICELRRMLQASDNFNNAVKQLIVGRLCHLLKFRLTALPTLLDPNSSPAALQGTAGMISLTELSAAFNLADDTDNGLITFKEAMQAVDSAFSGTHFHGAEMVQETLLLASESDRPMHTSTAAPASGNSIGTGLSGSSSQGMVTLNELTLLLARGIRHEQAGSQSALGTIQNSLDDIISTCMQDWAKDALKPYVATLSTRVKSFVAVICTSTDSEYQRVYMASEDSPPPLDAIGSSSSPVVSNVSPHVVSFFLDISHILNRSVCPSDSMLPVPSKDYASDMGIEGIEISCMADLIRWALLSQGAEAAVRVLKDHVLVALTSSTSPAMKDSGPLGVAQLKNDLSFIQRCFFDRNRHGFGGERDEESTKAALQKIIMKVDVLVRRVCAMDTLRQIEAKQAYVFEVCDLFFSSLLGNDTSLTVPIGDLHDNVTATSGSGATPLYHAPLPSSCRFPLLPIQDDRILSGVQARGKYKEKQETDSRSENIGGSAVRAGFGFFSNMLKKS